MPSQKRGARRSGHRRKRTEHNGKDGPTLKVYNWDDQEGLLPISLLDTIDNSHEKDEKDPPLLPQSLEINIEKWNTLWNIWRSMKTEQMATSVDRNESPFDRPTEIQRQAWPLLLAERSHAVLIAPTGSGKTLAYGLPLVVNTLSTTRTGIQGIVLVPTRELALQVQTTLSRILKSTVLPESASSVKVIACYGGVQSSQEQVQLLAQATFVTATPGRLLDLLPQLLPPDRTNGTPPLIFAPSVTVVLDEADRLATHRDLSQQVEQIWQLLRHQSPTTSYHVVLGSATWPPRATSIWKDWWSQPSKDAMTERKDARSKCTVITIDTMVLHATGATAVCKTEVDDRSILNLTSGSDADVPSMEFQASQDDTSEPTKRHKTTRDESMVLSKIPSHLKQVLHVCAEHKKPKKLLHTLDLLFDNKSKDHPPSTSSPPPTGIIFFDKIKTIQYIHQLLQKERPHIPCSPWHSQLQASQREHVFSQFIRGGGKKNTTSFVLLATDVAARGVHTDHLQFVIHYDFPSNLAQYVHRCGRAGRGSALEESHAATIYSFFTRNLAPLAPDMITLLEATQQWVDPNLRALVPKDSTAGTSIRKNKAAAMKKEADAAMNEYDGEDDDPFLHQLLGNRIVLTRASHVSDASSSAESDDDAGV